MLPAARHARCGRWEAPPSAWAFLLASLPRSRGGGRRSRRGDEGGALIPPPPRCQLPRLPTRNRDRCARVGGDGARRRRTRRPATRQLPYLLRRRSLRGPSRCAGPCSRLRPASAQLKWTDDEGGRLLPPPPRWGRRPPTRKLPGAAAAAPAPSAMEAAASSVPI